MSAGWYTSTDGEIRGPFDASTIRLMAASGDLKPTDHLRRGEVGEWVAAANTKGLEFGSPPVPVSPPTVRRVVAELAPDPPPWVPPGQSPQYVYKMVQIPRNVEIKEGMSQRGRAAGYLESVVNEHARSGWEFFRVDQIGIHVNPGCLTALFGAKPTVYLYYVVTFRKPA